LNPWAALVEALTSAVTWLGAAVGGGRAAGILLLALGVRAALIPLILPLAVRTRARQRVVRRIRPQIRALDREYRDEPSELSRRLKALHQENGIEVVDWPGLGGALIQLPILIALFQAVLLVWAPEALTLSGLALGALAGAVSFVGTKWSGQAEGAPFMLWLSLLLPVAISLWLGTGIALYLVGFYAGSAIQGVLMPKDPPTAEDGAA
jgi:membrane protein insertase Oxa1/YidC/SpoIIIJ